MKCKDIPDIPILEFLSKFEEGMWCNWYEIEPGKSWSSRSVRNAMPKDTPAKLVLAKMRMLMRRELVQGCGCGCRGDFEITQRGREFLANYTASTCTKD